MSLGKRALAIWMPRLPVNRFGRIGLPIENYLFAVTSEEKNAVRLFSLNKHAQRLGLTSGMTLATARAIAPQLITIPHEPVRDTAFLKALQRWCIKFTPWSSCSGTDFLLLNITGCAHLFDGEKALARLISQELSDLGVENRIGIADTKLAAKAAARFGSNQHTIFQAGQTKNDVSLFPVEALFLESHKNFELKRLGIKRIGDLYPLKSSDLARRIGFGLLKSYEKLLGTTADPITPAANQPVFAARISFPDPIGKTEDINEALDRLATQVCKRLYENAFGVRSIRLSIYRADKEQFHIDIGLARPTQEKNHIIRQFTLKLDKIDAGCGIDMMRLFALKAEPFKPIQKSFAEAEKHNDLDELIATIGNRLGFDRVLRWKAVESHSPQGSFRFVEAVQQAENKKWQANAYRPLVIYEGEPVSVLRPGRPPKQFKWRHKIFTAAHSRGPERIGPEWWKGPKGGELRDYWRIDCKEGPRLWLATNPAEKPSSWAVTGVFP